MACLISMGRSSPIEASTRWRFDLFEWEGWKPSPKYVYRFNLPLQRTVVLIIGHVVVTDTTAVCTLTVICMIGMDILTIPIEPTA